MKKKLITLARELDFSTETEHMDYLIDCHINGNFTQCRRLFAEMRREDQKKLLYHCAGFSRTYEFYFELL